MQTLERTFRILVVCGCWRPRSWSSPQKKFLYSFYSITVLLLIFNVTFCQLMDIIVNVRNRDEFSENFYLLLAMLVSCHKLYNLLTLRGKIADFIDIFGREPFLPANQEEIDIRTRFNERAEFITLVYAVLVQSTVIAISCLTLFKIGSRKLPMRSWLPYNYSSPLTYSVTYVHNALALNAGALTHVACDGLLCGLLIYTCSQFEILGCRLRAIRTGENHSARRCVRYHNHVYRFARMINKEFRMIIFVQFLVSTLVVCFNLYMLAEAKGTAMFTVIMYTSCMLMQIFVYCWYGNEVKLKSLEISTVIFETDWTSLDNNARRILYMIMKRSTIPIEFTSVHVVSMNLESFVNLLKTAYSAYNLLQNGRE